MVYLYFIYIKKRAVLRTAPDHFITKKPYCFEISTLFTCLAPSAVVTCTR